MTNLMLREANGDQVDDDDFLCMIVMRLMAL